MPGIFWLLFFRQTLAKLGFKFYLPDLADQI